eukprot:TRINITY_DN127768_c0_g1_i1.p1 TRINITY_DN127768_c0_g1~~TRINITY_DN127768_c0_g1_i1.p1  ORF type:complete len:122 (+),score=5.47 TRINITY_DN127768_c0_g1_i1:125-490(+)
MSHGKPIFDDFEYIELNTAICIYPATPDRSLANGGKQWRDYPITEAFSIEVGRNQTHGQNVRTKTEAAALQEARQEFEVRCNTRIHNIQRAGNQKIVTGQGREADWHYNPNLVRATNRNRT